MHQFDISSFHFPSKNKYKHQDRHWRFLTFTYYVGLDSDEIIAVPEGAQEYSLLQEYYFCGTPAEKVSV